MESGGVVDLEDVLALVRRVPGKGAMEAGSRVECPLLQRPTNIIFHEFSYGGVFVCELPPGNVMGKETRYRVPG